jgi:ATP-dependent DNA ligase
MPILSACPLSFAFPPNPTPSRPAWTGLHEVKYDGYRLRLERDGDRVRLITRGGYNWTSRYPWIVEAALKNHHKQFVIEVSNRASVSIRTAVRPTVARQCRLGNQ